MARRKAEPKKIFGTCKGCGYEAVSSAMFSIHLSFCTSTDDRYTLPESSPEYLAWQHDYLETHPNLSPL